MNDVEGINFHEPFGYIDYNNLQLNAKCVVSDSGTISEESAIAGFPGVSLRDSIERPESIDSGSMILTGLDATNLVLGVKAVLGSKNQTLGVPAGYESSEFSERVLRFLISSIKQYKFWFGIR
jgi:UDP-N-acetylglucosamine 2-epimerase (non-hydrolysing)